MIWKDLEMEARVLKSFKQSLMGISDCTAEDDNESKNVETKDYAHEF